MSNKNALHSLTACIPTLRHQLSGRGLILVPHAGYWLGRHRVLRLLQPKVARVKCTTVYYQCTNRPVVGIRRSTRGTAELAAGRASIPRLNADCACWVRQHFQYAASAAAFAAAAVSRRRCRPPGR